MIAPRVVHKFKLEASEKSFEGVNFVALETEMPLNAEVIDIEWQGGDLFAWAIVPLKPKSKQKMEPRWWLMVGTGWEIPGGIGEHVTTVRDNGLVWHIFRVR